MREIVSHMTYSSNTSLSVQAVDDPGHGGANHKYVISYPRYGAGKESVEGLPVHLNFQNGTISETGVNGITNESLLAVVADRLDGFQNGPFACLENEAALSAVRAALRALQSRTLSRMARGVEGTHAV